MQGKKNSGLDAMRDIEDVHSKSTAGKKESSCRRQKIVQNATRLTIIATHLKGFALMTEDLQQEITVFRVRRAASTDLRQACEYRFTE
jgi:hypothetical protein